MKLHHAIACLVLAACGSKPTPPQAPDAGATADATDKEPAGPTVAEAKAFIADLNERLHHLKARAETAEYIKATFITPDTERNAASAQADVMAFLSEAIPKAATFRDLDLPADDRRTLKLLRTSPTLPAPADKELRNELAALSAKLEGHYGSAKGCSAGPDGEEACRDLGELSAVLRKEDATWDELYRAWMDWRSTAREQRPRYQRLVELGNQGAKELGFDDLGALWRSPYDMPPEEFAAEIDRLWNQVRPLYEKLHCLVRDRLSKKWGADKVPADGLIPAHLFGNMWAQDWSGVFDLVKPYPDAPATNITQAIADKGIDAREMVKIGERFFTSLGHPPLPETFWANSQFTKPRDREVVCHASAWDLTYGGEMRIKMCIEPTEEDFITVHHELGHIYYFLAYYKLPVLYQNGANDGFHEAIGDAIALSVTPSYLVEVGLMDEPTESDQTNAKEAMLNEQMKRALEKIAFLPFGRLIDQWRWDVFSGEIPPDKWNQGWWDLRARIQGVAPPAPRTEADFDPGAKYHIPASVPYMRYFLAAVLQFQFHRALCKVAGHEGPLNECSIYGNKEAGKKLWALLEAGASKPWPEALAAMTGEDAMDASAILEYFAPLSSHLDEATKGLSCGY